MYSTHTVRWMPEPKEKGTWGLLTSLALTLWLCVYTALHLNVPSNSEGELKKYKRKTKWVLLGIFAPKFVVYTALMQCLSAKKLTSLIAKHYVKPENGKEPPEWSLKHSYFAQMGGFVVETNRPTEDSYILASPRLSLTANGISILAATGHLPRIPVSFIDDKSKTNRLGKVLASLQGSWILLQCIGRLADHLPITLLEIHTSAHVICALTVYFFWMEKPLDVEDPVLLNESEAPSSLIAAMWMFSYVKDRTYFHKNELKVAPPEIESLVILEQSDQPSLNTQTTAPYWLTAGDAIIEMEHLEPGRRTSRFEDVDNLDSIQTEYPDNFKLLNLDSKKAPRSLSFKKDSIRGGEVLQPFGYGPKSWSVIFQSWLKRKSYSQDRRPAKYRGYYTYLPPVSVDIDEETLLRWKLAKESFNEYPEIWNRHKIRCDPERQPKSLGPSLQLCEYPTKSLKESYLTRRIPNAPWNDLLKYQEGWAAFVAIILASLYGGLHAGAWMDYFPTDTEQNLWRASSVAIIGTVVVVVLAGTSRLIFDSNSWLICCCCFPFMVADTQSSQYTSLRESFAS